jgi:hypothetical protein
MIRRALRGIRRAIQASKSSALHFDRPLVLFQSDDWGRAGVRDREGWEELRAAGMNLGEKPYDFYSLETAEDLHALREVLGRHRDSVGRKPTIVMNFIMANLDFARCLETDWKQIPLHPLSKGVPGTWERPQLLEAYREGVREGVFFPALHGLTHFCERAIVRELRSGGERAQMVRKLWHAQTPYIYWRMPWIGYEYWDGEQRSADRFLPLDKQRNAIQRAADIFRELFNVDPFSACAPGYRANADSVTSWFETGVRVAQNGPGRQRRPSLDRNGMLSTFRTAELEPALASCDMGKLLHHVEDCFASGVPAVISIHSINFHSTLCDFRTPTLKAIDELMTAIENRWPEALYVHDGDLYSLATEGFYVGDTGKITVHATTVEAGK